VDSPGGPVGSEGAGYLQRRRPSGENLGERGGSLRWPAACAKGLSRSGRGGAPFVLVVRGSWKGRVIRILRREGSGRRRNAKNLEH